VLKALAWILVVKIAEQACDLGLLLFRRAFEQWRIKKCCEGESQRMGHEVRYRKRT